MRFQKLKNLFFILIKPLFIVYFNLLLTYLTFFYFGVYNYFFLFVVFYFILKEVNLLHFKTNHKCLLRKFLGKQELIV